MSLSNDRKVNDLSAQPYWFQTTLPIFTDLNFNLEVDVVIVGGGLTGLTAGYLLANEGVRVAIIERGRLASADTGHTTAHLTYVTDYRLHDLVAHFGRDNTRALWQAGATAIDMIESIAARIGVDCEFKRVPGYLHNSLRNRIDSESSRELDRLHQDCDLANELGFSADWVAKVPYANLPGVRLENQAKFHPRKYLQGLINAIFGGDDVKTGQEPDTERVFETLSSRFMFLFPEAQISHRWMGQVVETDDGLPFIGENASRQFIATGFCGNGFTLGSLAASMARDRFLQREHGCTDLLRVDRKPFHGGVWRYI